MFIGFYSPNRARTYNITVNSRALYHWAIEEYIRDVPSKLHTKIYQLIYQTNPFRWAYQPEIILPLTLLSWSSPRSISSSPLHALPHFHSCPIHLVVSQGPYWLGDLILEGASRLDAFSVYPVRTWPPCCGIGTPAGTPAVRPARSSRTKARPPQISSACAG